MSAHDRYLQRALVLAKQNIADGGRPFGAVLVRNDEIVAESVNTFHLSGDPTAHAELNAVRDIAARLNQDPRIIAYAVESENFESIHNHSAYAMIERDKAADVVAAPVSRAPESTP